MHNPSRYISIATLSTNLGFVLPLVFHADFSSASKALFDGIDGVGEGNYLDEKLCSSERETVREAFSASGSR